MTASEPYLDRRKFLGGAAGLAAGMAMPARASAMFGAGAGVNGDILVVVFMHGAMDGLNLLAPVDDANYIAARPDTLRLSASGPVTGLQINGGPSSQDWRLHPSATGLKSLYDSGKLAFIHASGLLADSRSHFQSIDLMERGITDGTQSNSSTGGLARHMRNIDVPLSAVATSTIVPGRLIGDLGAVGMTTPASFQLARSDFGGFLAAVYSGSAPLANVGGIAIGAINSFARSLALQPSITQPAGTTGFQTALNTIVQLIKFQVGLQVATVEIGGWDTHYNQRTVFAANVADLSKSLTKFQSDIEALGANVTLVTVTEFGRRLKANANGGTDHGHGSVMMVMGNAVNGGKVYGKWPGLATSALNLGDLNITTDYRNVIGEILTQRRGEGSLSSVFPSLPAYTPLNILKPLGS